MTASRVATLVRSWSRPRDQATELFGARDAAIFVALWAYYLLYPHQGFEGLIPDNIAQTAYWSLLTRPELVGSIGSSTPKAGLIVFLGATHYLSYDLLGSAWVFKAILALFIAGALTLIGRIAAGVGGPIAGLLAVLVAGSIYLPRNFYHGTSYLFFLPPVLLGMYLLSIGRDRAAVLALCLAATIRPEALIIIAMVIAIRYLRRGDWRKTLEFAGYAAIALLFFVLLAYWTQGSWDRIGGAAATGYPAPASFQTLEHIRVTLGRLFSERFVAPLLLPALFASVRVARARTYLYFVSTFLAFFVLAVTDFMIVDYRFIAPLQVFIFALGCGGIMRVFTDLRQPVLDVPSGSTLAIATAVVGLVLAAAFWSTRNITTCLLMLAIPTAYLLSAAAKHRFGSDRLLFGGHVAVVLLLAVTSIASAVETQQKFGASLGVQRAAILDALELLSDPQLPPGSAVIAEDELLNYVLAKRPDYLTRARSIQSFNVLTNTQKTEALSEAQFLYVSKRPNKGWNYLFYLPKSAWRNDPFRTIVIEMIQTNQPRSIFGSVLKPIHNSNTRFTARILPDPDG